MINQDLLFSAQNNQSKAAVSVFFGDTAIHTITGPVPLVDISKNINYTEGGAIDSITHQVTLTGKIFKVANTGTDVNGQPQPSGGINTIVDSIKRLENLFVGCANGTFAIKCDNNFIYLATGVRVTSFNADKTQDNWTQSADYTVSMEYKTGATDRDDDQVENKSDSWTIEPLDDIVYTRFTYNVSQKGEWSNPQMLPTAPSVGSPIPATAVGGGSFGAGENSLQILSIPQFRISRRLSAKGLPPVGSGTGTSGLLCPGPTGNTSRATKSYLSAKKWVDKQLAVTFSGGKIVDSSGNVISLGVPYVADNAFGAGIESLKNEFNTSQTWLYNHTRSINIDVYGGTYEANDSWIAMPTGILYTEQYTIETSTSDQYTKTVTVAGNIQGLALTPLNTMDGTTGVFPTGTGTRLSLGYSLIEPSSVSINYDLNDVSGVASKNTLLSSSKYLNALSGWSFDIKPYLYRRASLAINSPDRTLTYMNPAVGLVPQPPNNPIYSLEVLLSTIPISTTEGHDPKKGTISYSYQYTNRLNIISGVLSENISITHDAPSDIVSETQVIGRSRGPLLRKTGVTATRKSVSIEVAVMPPTGVLECFISETGCPLYTGGFIYTTIEKLLDGIKPFGIEPGTEANYNDLYGTEFVNKKKKQGIVFKQSDTDSWNPTGGRYSRNVTWIYQQCNEFSIYLDH